MCGIKRDFPSYIYKKKGENNLELEDLLKTREIETVSCGENEPEQEQAAPEEKKGSHSLPFLLTVQWAVCLAAAILFLGVRFFIPERADEALSQTAAQIQRDFSFAPAVIRTVRETFAELWTGTEAAAAGIPQNATTAPVVYTGRCTFPIETYTRISSPFGERIDPIGGGEAFHKGVDIAAPAGTRILAAENGTVVKSEYDEAFGYYIKIDHGNGFYTLYGHCEALVAQEGMCVRAGDVVGYVGSTGSSTGNHLHFAMVKNGLYFDPAYVYEAFAVHEVSLLPAMGRTAS